jgi:hypothetical protein
MKHWLPSCVDGHDRQQLRCRDKADSQSPPIGAYVVLATIYGDLG